MKHITTYTLFEGVSKETKQFESLADPVKYEIKNTLDDILCDIKDDGFDVYCSMWSRNVTVNIGKNSFYYSDIEGCIKHVISYLGEVGYLLKSSKCVAVNQPITFNSHGAETISCSDAIGYADKYPDSQLRQYFNMEFEKKKSVNESTSDIDMYNTFVDCFLDIKDMSDEGFTVYIDKFRKCVVVRIRHNKAFDIRQISEQLIQPFSYSKELGFEIDSIQANDFEGNEYDVEETKSLQPIIKDGRLIKTFLDDYFDEYDCWLNDIQFNFNIVNPTVNEGIFDFFKKKKLVELPPDKTVREECAEITEEIVDSMWDIFDEFEIKKIPQEENEIIRLAGHLSNGNTKVGDGYYWYYNYSLLNNDQLCHPSCKNGIIICLIDRIQGKPGKDINSMNYKLLSAIKKIAPIVNSRTGISLNKIRPSFGGDFDEKNGNPVIVIDFLPYANTRKRNSKNEF